jgi:hypothetical protein
MLQIQESKGCVLRFQQSQCWLGTNPMDRAELHRVYELGGAIHRLADLSTETTLRDYFRAYVGAEKALNMLLSADPQVRVDLCLDAARHLLKIIRDIETNQFRDEKGNFDVPSDPSKKLNYDYYGLRDALQNFEAVFRAEMQAASTYWVPKRGTHSTRDLVDTFDRTFLPELHPTIGEIALNEYRNAGRCFAFGLWTAAGYHTCRAVEAVLRPYYRTFTGKESKDGQTWHNLIEGLEGAENEPKPVDKTLFYLRQLKDNERNPLMHVRVVLDEQDADLLLSAAKIVIIHMARELQSRPAQSTNTLAAPPKQTMFPKRATANDKAG